VRNNRSPSESRAINTGSSRSCACLMLGSGGVVGAGDPGEGRLAEKIDGGGQGGIQ